jgi:hypothetical protein
VTPAPKELAGAYASLAEPEGIRLYGSAEALREVARLLGQKSPAETRLAAPPADVVEVRAIRTVRVLPADAGPIELRSNEDAIEIAGGIAARRNLAATFENLAGTPQVSSPVPRHVDLEYFPGHSFLSEDSMWMTIFLVPESSS